MAVLNNYFGISLNVEVVATSFRISLFYKTTKPFAGSTIPGSHSSIVVVATFLVIPKFV